MTGADVPARPLPSWLLSESQMKIDTSPFSLSPFEAERKSALIDCAVKGELC